MLIMKLQATYSLMFLQAKESNIMERRMYEQTADYQKSLQIVRDFIEEELGGDIEKFRTFCFDDMKNFKGSINDPDMYYITQAIYIILWGDIFDLTFDKMGAWNVRNTYPFRGDTMNSFGSMFGKEDKENGYEFGRRAKMFGADKDEELWNRIQEFYRIYHRIGNFIVIPNRGSVKYGINGARGRFYDDEQVEGMRDYFDWFLIALATYQDKLSQGENDFTRFEKQLHMNPEYAPDYFSISDWEKRFFLEPYFKDDKPTLLFDTPFENRLKTTAAPSDRKHAGYYSDEEYLALMKDYLDKSEMVIDYRTDKIIETLKKIV